MTTATPPPQVAHRGRRGAVLGASAIAALGGLLFGYDTGVISAALLHTAPELALSGGLQQIVVASLLLGAIAGAVGAGQVVDRIGRKITLIVLSVVFTAGALMSAPAPNAEGLIGLDALISISVLTLINALTATGLFWICGALGILGLVYLYRNLLETKNRTLEDIESSLRARSEA